MRWLLLHAVAVLAVDAVSLQGHADGLPPHRYHDDMSLDAFASCNDALLASLCTITPGSDCRVCVGRHQHELRPVGCTVADVDLYCGGDVCGGEGDPSRDWLVSPCTTAATVSQPTPNSWVHVPHPYWCTTLHVCPTGAEILGRNHD